MRAVSLGLVAVTLALGVVLSPVMGAEDHVMVTPNDLTWAEVPSLPPGAQVAVIEGPLDQATPFTIRLKLPADDTIPAHWHPAIAHVTVLSGTCNLGMGDKLDPTTTTALSAGSMAMMQPKTTHCAWTKEETMVQVYGVGPWAVHDVDPADDPRKKP